MKFLRITFLSLIFLSANASAQDAGIGGVIQGIVMGSGPVTKAEYDKFWAQTGMTAPEDKARMIELLKKQFVFTQEYQREVWSCAEQAWNSRNIPTCEKATNKLALLKTEMQRIDNVDAVKPMEEYTTNLLSAAAKHEPMKNQNGGPAIPLSLEMIQSTKVNLDKMLSRFGQVLQPSFKQ